MMESTRPKSHTGDYNIKRRFGKGFRNSKKSIMIFSNHNKKDDVNDSNYEDSISSTPHRSCSLNALHTGQVLLQPRMAQLETLEAKMARIENSLSTTPRKKKMSSSNSSITSALTAVNGSSVFVNASNECNQTPLSECKSNSLRSISTFPKMADNGSMLIYKTSRDIAREMEALKNALRDKENVIDNLKGQLNTSLNFSRLSTTYLQARHKGDHVYCDKKAAEDRLQRLKHEMDTKSLLIKNIKLELERLDVTDNIDVRIKQAELEYQLGREELNLLSILEEIQSLKIILEERNSDNHQSENTLFGFVQRKPAITLHATEIVYDAKSPRFGANITDDGNAVYVDWAVEDSGLTKGDILLEINGKITLDAKNRDDVIRLLSVSPNPAQIVVMRQHNNDAFTVSTLQQELNVYREKAGEAERIRDSFRSDNLRLTHRISYLEEQVAELLCTISGKGNNVNIDGDLSINGKPPTSTQDDHRSPMINGIASNSAVGADNKAECKVQIFQKGSKITLVNDVSPTQNSLKIRDSLPTIQNRMRSKHQTFKSMDGRSTSKEECYNHRHADPANVTTPNGYIQSTPDGCRNDEYRSRHSSSVDRSSSKSSLFATPPSSNSRNKENYYNLVNERRLRYLRETQGGLLNCNGERALKHFKDDRSCKSVDFDSEPNYHGINHSGGSNGRLKMYDSETSSDYSKTIKYDRPIPPQKPLRLSLHKGCSLQSVKIIDKSSSDLNLCKKNTSSKRSQRLETAKSDLGVRIDKCNEKWC